MSLAETIAQPFDGVKFVPGSADVYPLVSIGGVTQPAAWPDTVYAGVGDPLIIAQIVKRDAPAQNVVVARVGAAGPREGTVSSVPGGSDTITVTAGGTDYTATFGSTYTPIIGDRVRLLWQGRDVTVLDKVGVTPAASSPAGAWVAPPPPPASTGQTAAPAIDASSFWGPGGWGSWSRGVGVYQGDYGSGPVTGAWFYGTQLSQLEGATITRIQFRVPARKSAGAYNSAGTLHVYAHTSPTRPSGDVNRVTAAMDVPIAAGWGGDFIDLPLDYASTLIAGGGISIAGNPYMGFKDKAEDAASGQILLDWSR